MEMNAAWDSCVESEIFFYVVNDLALVGSLVDYPVAFASPYSGYKVVKSVQTKMTNIYSKAKTFTVHG